MAPYVYDALGRVGSIAHFVDGDADRQYDSGSETLFDKFDYSYFADGSRASETRTNADGTTTVEWTYDGLNRLIEEEFSGYDGQGDPLAYTDTYSFDLASNRTKLVHDDQTSGGGGSAGPDSTTTYEYDANDRLLAETKDVAGSTADDRHTVYGYSPTDQTSKTVHEGLDDQGAVAQDIDFIYDATGRMTGVTMAVGSTTTTVTYKYDHNGFRVEATVDDGSNPPVTRIFHVDPANPTGYAQVVEQGVDADADGRLDASEIEKAFVIGLDLLTQATASALLHLLTDAHGSTKAVLNAATSSVAERYVYSAYGIDLGLGSSPATSFRYAGEFIDPVTGLSFNRARWYDALLGRLAQIDPWVGNIYQPTTLHEYAYALANPILFVDPNGETPIRVIIAIVALMAVFMLLSPNTANAPAPGGPTYPDTGGDMVVDGLMALAIVPPLYYAGRFIVTPALQWLKLRVARPAVQAGGEGIAAEGGFALDTLPGSAGIQVSRRLTPQEMADLTIEHGVEFSLIYRVGAGPNGGGGTYWLYSGTSNRVIVPTTKDVRWIYHTHPGGTPYASKADRGVLYKLQQNGSPQETSQIIPIGRPVFRFGDPIPPPPE